MIRLFASKCRDLPVKHPVLFSYHILKHNHGVATHNLLVFVVKEYFLL